MAKIWKEDHPIPWICNEDQKDFFAAIGNYSLRVEQMRNKQWWWRVSYYGDPIPTVLNEYASCRTTALRLAEGVYYGHLAAMSANEATYLSKLIHKP